MTPRPAPRPVRTGRLAAALALALVLPARADDADVFDCIMNPAVVVQVGSPVAGLIDEVLVGPGDLVEAGQEIATLRSEVERTTVAVMGEQAASTAEIEAQKARLGLAESRLARAEKLVERRIATQEELEAARAETEVIGRELAIAELRRRIAGLELERAREVLAQRTIRSPIDGVVVERTLYSGEFLHQEAHVMTIAQIDPLMVEAFLPVRLYPRIRPGTLAVVTPNAPVGGEFEGEVTVVERVFDAASGTFGIRVRLDNPGLAMPAGHRCRVAFRDLAPGG